MSQTYVAELPAELILVISSLLSTSSLNALCQACRRLSQILQPELDYRITPEVGQELLLSASSSSNSTLVHKLLSPPHSIHPSATNPSQWNPKAPLHAAVQTRNIEIAQLLLDAGADPALTWGYDDYQPFHLAAQNKDLEMMKLLLKYRAPIDERFGDEGILQNALHYACSQGHMEMIRLLLERGAFIECTGHFGTPLGFAVHWRQLEAVKFLLERGANVTRTASLYIIHDGAPPKPHSVDLIYLAMGLRRPRAAREWTPKRLSMLKKWEGLPLDDGKRELMALLMAYGASKDVTMGTILQYLTPLAKSASLSEEEFLRVIDGMFKEAEDMISDVVVNRPWWKC
ncbi:ANK-REP-region domain-containing protein [Favolaschia claudopus]|uniref:ANK-REP-region domain-containing protein n=1 Tax=Favolaschia claudopus TaxID=2862362 RepID=A0AAW0BEV2_9AGAR